VLTVCVCGTVTDVETNPLTHSLVSVGAPAQHIGTTTASMRFFIFRGRRPVVLIYHCAKIHSLSSRNKLSREMRVFGLSRFLPHFSLF